MGCARNEGQSRMALLSVALVPLGANVTKRGRPLVPDYLCGQLRQDLTPPLQDEEVTFCGEGGDVGLGDGVS